MSFTFAPPMAAENIYCSVLIYGPTGSGKTRSALTLARGFIGPAGKIAVICTEPKGTLANKAITPFDQVVLGYDKTTADGLPIFDVDELIDAMRAAAKTNYDAIIIDSLSDYWDGPGGMLEMKNALDKKNYKLTFSNNQVVTKLCDEITNLAIFGGRHYVYTAFARRKTKQIKDEIVDCGVQPRLKERLYDKIDYCVQLDAETNPESGKVERWAWYTKNRWVAPPIGREITGQTARQMLDAIEQAQQSGTIAHIEERHSSSRAQSFSVVKVTVNDEQGTMTMQCTNEWLVVKQIDPAIPLAGGFNLSTMAVEIKDKWPGPNKSGSWPVFVAQPGWKVQT